MAKVRKTMTVLDKHLTPDAHVLPDQALGGGSCFDIGRVVKGVVMGPIRTVDLTKGVYRKVYAGFISGKRICSVSIGAEAWFWRLNVIADDFGNLIGDMVLLCRFAMGRRTDDPSCARVWTTELITANLIGSYEVLGEPYLHIFGFCEFQPAGKNGRRIKRHPESPWCVRVNAGESKAIQGNPANLVPPKPSPKPIPIAIPNPKPSPNPSPALERPGKDSNSFANVNGLRAGPRTKVEELDKSIAIGLLRRLRWGQGSKESLHFKTVASLSTESGCTADRVWWLCERITSEEADDPASFMIAGIKEKWDVAPDVTNAYIAWRSRNYGEAHSIAQRIDATTKQERI